MLLFGCFGFIICFLLDVCFVVFVLFFFLGGGVLFVFWGGFKGHVRWP